MAIAVLVTVTQGGLSFELILAGVVVGAAIGAVLDLLEGL